MQHSLQFRANEKQDVTRAPRPPSFHFFINHCTRSSRATPPARSRPARESEEKYRARRRLSVDAVVEERAMRPALVQGFTNYRGLHQFLATVPASARRREAITIDEKKTKRPARSHARAAGDVAALSRAGLSFLRSTHCIGHPRQPRRQATSSDTSSEFSPDHKCLRANLTRVIGAVRTLFDRQK